MNAATAIPLLFGALLALFAFGVAVYPFLKSRFQHGLDPQTGTMDFAEVQLESVYDAIRTLQLEFHLGHVPQELYQTQLQTYRIQAALALQAQGEGPEGDPDRALEQEVLAARAALQGLVDGASHCPGCNAVFETDTESCPRCGAARQPITPGPTRVPEP